MKRVVFGVVLLVVLLAVGFGVSFGMEQLQKPVYTLLDNAAEAALSDKFPEGIALAREAQTLWDTQWHMTASLADHAPMDEIDSLFAQLEAFSRDEEPRHFAASCLELAQLVQAVEEAHSLSWWNLL